MSDTFFSVLGGEPGLRALVDDFYSRMDSAPQYAGIRQLHPPELKNAADKLFWFLCGWTGGPNHFMDRFGHPRLRARHLPFAIGVAERDQWLGCMADALQASGLSTMIQGQFLQALFGTADWMRNQPESPIDQ